MRDMLHAPNPRQAGALQRSCGRLRYLSVLPEWQLVRGHRRHHVCARAAGPDRAVRRARPEEKGTGNQCGEARALTRQVRRRHSTEIEPSVRRPHKDIKSRPAGHENRAQGRSG